MFRTESRWCLWQQGHDTEVGDTGEDERSVERHLLDISQEMTKLRPDFNLVMEKMKRTLWTFQYCVTFYIQNAAKISVVEKCQISKYAVKMFINSFWI